MASLLWRTVASISTGASANGSPITTVSPTRCAPQTSADIPRTLISRHTACDERAEAQEALQRDWNGGNIARIPPADVVRPRGGKPPPAVYIHIALPT